MSGKVQVDEDCVPTKGGVGVRTKRDVLRLDVADDDWASFFVSSLGVRMSETFGELDADKKKLSEREVREGGTPEVVRRTREVLPNVAGERSCVAVDRSHKTGEGRVPTKALQECMGALKDQLRLPTDLRVWDVDDDRIPVFRVVGQAHQCGGFARAPRRVELTMARVGNTVAEIGLGQGVLRVVSYPWRD